LFAPSVRQSAILQSLDALPQHSLEVPEACNLHPASDAIVGEDQYIFTRYVLTFLRQEIRLFIFTTMVLPIRACHFYVEVCTNITRQPIELESCSHHLRIRQVFQFRF